MAAFFSRAADERLRARGRMGAEVVMVLVLDPADAEAAEGAGVEGEV